jgi:hypothetical protein
MDDARERRLAANEAIAREVNAQVEQLSTRWDTAADAMDLLCECSDDACSERVHVPLDQYRDVRQHDARFMLVDSHVREEIEDRVGTAGDATVVEKRGPGKAVAEATA